MPKSRIRTKKGRSPQKTKAEKKKIIDSFYNKVGEYVALTWEEIEQLKNTKLTATYSSALKEAIKQKEAIELYTQKQGNEK